MPLLAVYANGQDYLNQEGFVFVIDDILYGLYDEACCFMR